MKNHPLFPLKVFLLPGEYTQLYIFEERYKQLIKDCFASSQTFGMAYSGKLNVQNLGSLVRIVEITKEHSNGELDIVVQSVGVFVLERFYLKAPEKLYPAGDIKLITTPIKNEVVSPALLKLYRDYFADKDHPDPELLWQSSVELVELLKGLFLSDYEKMDLVQLEDKEALETYLKNYIRYLKLLADQEKNVYQNIYLN